MALPWKPEESLEYLRQCNVKRPKNYYNLCANLVSQAAGFNGAGHASASAWGRSIPKSKRRTGTAPKGAVYFWVTNGWGHVAFSLGGGKIWTNDQKGNVSKSTVSAYNHLGTPFWVYSDASIYRNAFGINPYKKQSQVKPPKASKPAAKPNPGLPVIKWQTVLKRAKERLKRGKPLKTPSASVKIWQRALTKAGFKVVADGDFGPQTRKATAAYQLKQGYKGKVADGYPGPKTAARLAAKTKLFRLG